MLAYPQDDGVWEIPLTGQDQGLRMVEDGRDYTRRDGVAPAELRPGEFLCRAFSVPDMRETVAVSFRPFESINPNLDHRTYAVFGDGGPIWKKSPRVTGPEPAKDALDLRQDPILWDFAQDFWRRREAELWPIDQPDRTAINLGIANSAAGSTQDSLLNSGWPVVTFPINSDYVLRGMRGLSIGADTFARPNYPH